jgi:serine protease Do
MKPLIPVVLALAACGSVPTEQEIIQAAKDRVFPAVVFIKPIQEEFRGGRKERVQIFGSGAIISADGYVVTNNHVAEKATEIKCVLYDKEELSATVVGLDPETDLAVIKLDLSQRKSKAPLPWAKFGDSGKVREGDLVMAMGAPHGLERSVSRGIISSTERVFDFAPYNLFYQTDAAINPGNSGGPLVNENGEIVGINARAMRGAENMGFAIPADVAREVVNTLIAGHQKGEKESKVHRAWTGIKFQALQDFTRSSYVESTEGVLVASVDEGSPGEKAKLRAGDIVRTLNGAPVIGRYETDLPGVERQFARLSIGQPAKLGILRGRDLVDVAVTPTKKGRQEGEEFDCKTWNLTVKEITKFSDPHLYHQSRRGVYVLGIQRGGNAQTSGFMPYDIIVRVNEKEVESLDDLRAAYEEAVKLDKGKRKLRMRILRNGYPRYQVLEFEKDIEKIED